MESYKKNDILQIVKTLFKANENICKFAKQDPEGMTEVLIACQESAILLGTSLEKREEKETVLNLVKVLEDYCENLYQISINHTDEKLCKKLSKRIRKQLIQLNNDIIYGLSEDKKEIVFLPYKACMWDSLESIWEAAIQEKSCDVYVIPIPYFDRNSDGTLGEEHYEGDKYPTDVPITKYSEYDFEKRRPDIVFIHNPYDNCNRVTSVHPFFYSKNLNRFTQKLIYVPYFITKDAVPEHYCVLPGTINADRIYVQSEKAAKVYREELGKLIKNEDLSKKVVGIGSPKIDRVLQYKVDEKAIPEQWRTLLHNAESKKIILYNTHLNGLMSLNGTLAIEKIKDTLRWFKNREDTILWWRPHPLSIATARAMNPGIEAEYIKIVTDYKKEAWGIYDETEDLNRAIAISDAYFGDTSSVLLLYQQTGKPILQQNRRVRQEEKE